MHPFASLFSIAPVFWTWAGWDVAASVNRRRGVGLKLYQGRLWLGIRKNSKKGGTHWQRLPREVMSSLSLEVFHNHGDVALRAMVSGYVGVAGVGLDPRVFSNPNDSMILWFLVLKVFSPLADYINRSLLRFATRRFDSMVNMTNHSSRLEENSTTLL